MKQKIESLMAAETILTEVVKDMAAEFQSGVNWPREWMQKHVNERAILMKARLVLIERAEKLSTQSGN